MFSSDFQWFICVKVNSQHIKFTYTIFMPTCDSSLGRLLKESTRTMFFGLSESSPFVPYWIKTLTERFSQKFYLSSTTVELRGFELHWFITHF